MTVSTNSNNGSQNFSSGIYHNTSAGIGVYHSSIDGDFTKNEASNLINSRGNVDNESSGPEYAQVYSNSHNNSMGNPEIFGLNQN